MFQLAVIGPFAGRGLGVVRQCVACRQVNGRSSEWQCSGFGSGCLGLTARVASVAEADVERGRPRKAIRESPFW